MRDRSISVYISYSWRDPQVVAWVGALAEELKAKGFDVQYDKDQVRPGRGTLPDFMGQASTADWVLLVCEPTYKAASGETQRMVKAEMAAALGRIQAGDDHGVVVLLCRGDREKSIPQQFSHLPAQDFRDQSGFRQNLIRLADELRRPPLKSQERGPAAEPMAPVRQDGMNKQNKQLTNAPLSIVNLNRAKIRQHLDQLRTTHNIPELGAPLEIPSDSQVRSATLEWLRPEEKLRTFEWLGQIAKAFRRDEIELASAMVEQCMAWVAEDEALRTWCKHRAALLEYKTTDLKTPPHFRQQKNETVGELGNMLAQAFLLLGSGRKNEAIETATTIAQKALYTAGLAIVAFLGGSRLSGPTHRFTASLMVPMSDLEALRFQGSSAEATTNKGYADSIFGGIPHAQKLVVVADAWPTPRHVGFWVPVLTAKDSRLPGATEAFLDEAGSSVYKCDLPTVSFGEEVTRQWYDYMRNKFSEDFFVSLPYWKTLAPPLLPPVAVLNVNIKPVKEEEGDVRWLRLTHREWRLLAIERVARFARLAYMAHSVIDAAQNPDKAALFVWEGKDFKVRPWASAGSEEQKRPDARFRRKPAETPKKGISARKRPTSRTKHKR